jgi:glycerol-3-phosphate dehydrogenase
LFGPNYDLAVIGGGIHGSGLARDAAGRGLSVFLCEQSDLASGTSSASTKLVHGDLPALERLHFRAVQQALAERAVLLRSAPHIVRPLRFVLPQGRSLRPRFLRRLSLALYDRLGRQALPSARMIDLSESAAGKVLRRGQGMAIEFSDCMVDDSRLAILNAVDARIRGASINPRLRCVIAERDGKIWRLALESIETGERRTVTARALVNAAGPWAGDVLRHVIDVDKPPAIRLVKGSHVVLRRIPGQERAYLFRSAGGRFVYAIPYECDFTLLGATDEDFTGNPDAVGADDAEIAFLIAAASDFFRDPVSDNSIVWAYSGVRPVIEDGSASVGTRGILHLDASNQQAPVISIAGGSITTYRRTAEEVLERLGDRLRIGKPWTAQASLPGGHFPVGGVVDLVNALRAAYPFLDPSHAERLVGAYGTRAAIILAGARTKNDLGVVFGADLTEAEVAWLMQEEWAEIAEDVLWRRSKLGLRFTAAEAAALDDWMAQARSSVTAPAA